MTPHDEGAGKERAGTQHPSARDRVNDGPVAEGTPSPMELSSMPLDPIYAWGIVLEPVEILIERTSNFVAQLAGETYQRGQAFSDQELEERFLAFFDRLVEEGTLRRMPDAPPEMGRRILGPGRWIQAQRVRMQRLIEHWRDQDSPALKASPEG